MSSPFDFIVERTYVEPGAPVGILADAIDYTTGEYISITGGFHHIDACVLGQLTLVKQSGSAVGDDGRDFSDVTHIGSQFEKILRQEVLRPLKKLIDGHLIQVLKLDITEKDQGYEVDFRYKNMATSKERNWKLGAAVGGN